MLTLPFLRQALPDNFFYLHQTTVPKNLTCTIDSRSQLSPNSLFIALRGERFDGHDFLEDVAKAGVQAVLVEDLERVKNLPFTLVIHAKNSLRSLQNIAALWRQQHHTKVIGITGSFGKTITKELLSAILSQRFTVYRSPGSYNSQTGVPLSVLNIQAEHDIAIIEAGISKPQEMQHLEHIIKPDLGILTSIGLAHPKGLPTEDITRQEKMLLFEHIKDKHHITTPDFAFPKLVTSSYSPSSSSWNLSVQLSPSDTSTHTFTLHAPGPHMPRLALMCIKVASSLGCSIHDIRQGLASYQPSPMRLEVHTTPDQITLINDTYSADPVSAKAAVETLIQHAGKQRKIAILGEMLELGNQSQHAHNELGQWLANTHQIDQLITVGQNARWIAQGAQSSGFPSEHILTCQNLDELGKLLTQNTLLQPGDVVLFKASRAIGLERVAKLYLESLGPTRLTINLGAIKDNFHILKHHIPSDTKILAVVKSFGYGNDATRVSMTLIREGVNALSVAYADEAIPLRKTGINLPILVHNTLDEDLEKIVKYNLTALIYSAKTAERLNHISEQNQSITPVHIKIDTGMNRLGLQPHDVDAFIQQIKHLQHLDIKGIMTHLAAADIAEEDAFTHTQLDRLKYAINILHTHNIYPSEIHAANTAASWRFPEASFDMVRVGLGLYGLDPSHDVQVAHAPLREALQLSTRIIHLHTVKQGESIGYSRSYVAPHDQLIATIAIGYNDGLSRQMSNGGQLLIRETLCSIVGKVCMDVCMVDVTHIADAVQVGDEVVIFGQQGSQHLHINTMAERCNTISYELLCNISPRVRRIFITD